MEMQFDAENAISFLTAAVRIPTDWQSPLMSEKFAAAVPVGRGVDQEYWEIETFRKLSENFNRRSPGSRLKSIADVAVELHERFPQELQRVGFASAGTLLPREPKRQRGMLDYHRLNWLDSCYFSAPKTGHVVPNSSVVAFKPLDRPESPPWREYLFDTAGASGSYDVLAAIYDVLGLLAQRRSLISVGAQRRLCKIVLPWGRCRFNRHDATTSREYLLVPVITLLSRRATTQFRRTLTMTVFLLPNCADSAPVLDTKDLAALCQQAVWNDQSPRLPTLVGPGGVGAPLFEGPLHTFLTGSLQSHETHLPIVFDAIVRTLMLKLDVRPTSQHISESIRMLVAISRARSVVFGSVLHVDGQETPALWDQLTTGTQRDLAQHVGELLSVNAAREGREWLVGGVGFRLERMRVTNPYEEDTHSIVLYNPMSRFMVNIMPKGLERFPTVSLKLGVAWLNLLAGTVSSIKEILSSYRYELEEYRNLIELSKSPDDPGIVLRDVLKSVHKTTLTILEEIDVVYSFDLVTPTYKAAHARILEMEGIAQERDNLMRELEMTTALLRSEEADQLNREIALSTRSTEKSTRSTDDLTKFVVAFTVLSTILAVNALIDAAFKETLDQNYAFWTMIKVDIGLIIAFGIGLFVYYRRRAGKVDA